jgi:hypothetical protein
MRGEYQEFTRATQVGLRDPETGKVLHRVIAPEIHLGDSPSNRVLVVAGGGSLSVLNRARFPEAGEPVVCMPLSELRNFAVFSDATGARQYYLGLDDPENVALVQLENDPHFRKRTMAGVGRAMVLNVLNPTPRVRVLVNHTGSFRGAPEDRVVPPLQVVGDRRVPLGAIGVGASRLVSPPLATQAAGSGHYLVVDFGPELRRNPNRLPSFEQFWGTELPRDRRWLSGHAREISVLSEEEYAAFQPPQAVKKFPADLAHPHLEYSGFTEDSWVGAEAKMRLSQADANQQCVVRGHVPGLPGGGEFRTELTVLVDGVAGEPHALKPGDFEVRLPGGSGAGPRWVELRFSHTQVLPAPDGRRVAARVTFIGFESRSDAVTRAPQ